jgi:hypothetical protein
LKGRCKSVSNELVAEKKGKREAIAAISHQPLLDEK